MDSSAGSDSKHPAEGNSLPGTPQFSSPETTEKPASSFSPDFKESKSPDLQGELNQVKEKLSRMDEKFDQIFNLISGITSMLLPEGNSGIAERNPAGERQFAERSENSGGRMRISKTAREFSAGDENSAEAKEISQGRRELRRGDENIAPAVRIPESGRELRRGDENIGEAMRISQSGREYQISGENIAEAVRIAPGGREFKGAGENLNGEIRKSTGNSQAFLYNEKAGTAKADSSKESLPNAGNIRKPVNSVNGALEFLRIWKSIPKDMRESRKNKRIYVEFIRQYPELKLPGTIRLNYEIRHYGLENVRLAPRLSDLMSVKLGRKYSTDTFSLSMAKILRQLYKDGMSTRSEIIAGAAVSKATLNRGIKKLMELGLATALKRGRDICHYVITQAGREVVEKE